MNAINFIVLHMTDFGSYMKFAHLAAQNLNKVCPGRVITSE